MRAACVVAIFSLPFITVASPRRPTSQSERVYCESQDLVDNARHRDVDIDTGNMIDNVNGALDPDPEGVVELTYGAEHFEPVEYSTYTYSMQDDESWILTPVSSDETSIHFDTLLDCPDAYVQKQHETMLQFMRGEIDSEGYMARSQDELARHMAYSHLSKAETVLYAGAIFLPEESKILVSEDKHINEAYHNFMRGKVSALYRNEQGRLCFTHWWEPQYQGLLPWHHY